MRILVVEDEPKIARGLKRGLEQEGFAVDIEDEFESGLLTAQSIDYDILIVDRMLPGGDGATLINTLRKEDINTPALLLTALNQTDDVVQGLENGADDYISKPFEFDELIARIQALLRRPVRLDDDYRVFGLVTVDLIHKRVLVNKAPIELSPKEFAVVECLTRRQGFVCSKDYLIEHVWDFDADILPNTVEAVVKNIRTKIDKKYDVPFIKTIRGKGYLIES